MNFTTYDAFNRITRLHIERITSFIFKHSKGMGDSKSAIRKAIEYSAKEIPGFGGKVFVAEEKDKIIGAAVVNKTGMNGYIPENILVHIATHKNCTEKNLRKKLIQAAKQNCNGEVALYMKPSNPSTFYYEVI